MIQLLINSLYYLCKTNPRFHFIMRLGRRLNSIKVLFRDDPKFFSRILRSFVDPVGYQYTVNFFSHKVRFRHSTSDYNEILFKDVEWIIPDQYKEQIALLGPLVLVDGGCSIGLSTIKLDHQLKLEKIVCIDPTASSLPIAKNNLQFRKNVVFYEVALGNKSGKGEVFNDDPDSMLSNEIRTSDDGRIKIMTLNEIFMNESLTDKNVILKLDVEGGAYSIFSADADLGWLDRVKILMMEFHENLSENSRIRKYLLAKSFKEEISSLGYSLFLRSSTNSPVLPV